MPVSYYNWVALAKKKKKKVPTIHKQQCCIFILTTGANPIRPAYFHIISGLQKLGSYLLKASWQGKSQKYHPSGN